MNESACQIIAELYPIHGMDFWRNCQVMVGHTWLDCTDPSNFSHNHEFRIKPRTHIVNGIECPEPMSEMPEIGDIYFSIDLNDPGITHCDLWRGFDKDVRRFELGNCFHTREDALANFYAHFPKTRENVE